VSLNEVSVSDKPTHIIVYNGDDSVVSEMKKQMEFMNSQITNLLAKVTALESNPVKYLARPSPFFGSSVAPELAGMEVQRLSPQVDPKETFKEVVETMRIIHHPVNDTPFQRSSSEAEPDLEDDAEVEPDLEDDAEVEDEAEAEVEDEAEAEAEEVEEEAVSLEEFTYKGETYYKDSENSVYQVDQDGDVDDTPIGMWNEQKQKIIKYKS
jgi:hypothetical protein